MNSANLENDIEGIRQTNFTAEQNGITDFCSGLTQCKRKDDSSKTYFCVSAMKCDNRNQYEDEVDWNVKVTKNRITNLRTGAFGTYDGSGYIFWVNDTYSDKNFTNHVWLKRCK